MLSIIAKLIYLCIIYAMSAFWSTLVLVRTIIQFVKNPSRYRYVKPRPHPPAVLTEFRHNFLPLYDGKIRIHYVESGDTNRPMMLFLHGFPEFWYSWRHQMREFQNDYHVVAIDLRGYGESSKPKSVSEYNLPNLVEDARNVIVGLGKCKCILMGHDWGGAVAWRLSIQYPELVEKLIIMNSPHPKAAISSGSWKQLLRSWYAFFYLCPYLPEIVMRANDMKLLINALTKPPSGCKNLNAFTEEDIEAWKYTFQQPGAMTSAMNIYRAVVPRIPFDRPEGSGKKSPLVQSPTLIIWGTGDIFLGTEMAHASLQFCQIGALRLIEGASHWVQQDQPGMCNDYIRNFLKE